MHGGINSRVKVRPTEHAFSRRGRFRVPKAMNILVLMNARKRRREAGPRRLLCEVEPPPLLADGGAPLLGVKGGCIVSHGRSNAKAMKNAIRMAADFARNRIDTKIQEKVGDLHTREHASSVLATQ